MPKISFFIISKLSSFFKIRYFLHLKKITCHFSAFLVFYIFFKFVIFYISQKNNMSFFCIFSILYFINFNCIITWWYTYTFFYLDFMIENLQPIVDSSVTWKCLNKFKVSGILIGKSIQIYMSQNLRNWYLSLWW